MAADPSRVFSSGAQRPRTPVPLVGARFSSRSLIVAPVDISLSRATAAATDRPRFPSWKDPAAINVNTASRCFPSMASRRAEPGIAGSRPSNVHARVGLALLSDSPPRHSESNYALMTRRQITRRAYQD